MSTPFGVVLLIMVSLPIASCGSVVRSGSRAAHFVGRAATTAARSAHNFMRTGQRAAPKTSKIIGQAAGRAGRNAATVSRAVWSQFSSAVDDALGSSRAASQALALARLAHSSSRAFVFLNRKYERNEAALNEEIRIANSGYPSDTACKQALARIQKLAREQAVITKLVTEMG